MKQRKSIRKFKSYDDLRIRYAFKLPMILNGIGRYRFVQPKEFVYDPECRSYAYHDCYWMFSGNTSYGKAMRELEEDFDFEFQYLSGYMNSDGDCLDFDKSLSIYCQNMMYAIRVTEASVKNRVRTQIWSDEEILAVYNRRTLAIKRAEAEGIDLTYGSKSSETTKE